MASDQNTESRLKTALADRYMINREIGSGGMATVYLATDIKHERDVAVKVLRPELAAALGAERFLREIKITAGLHHPHILPLLDSGEADSFLFYVMPFVEGETLREKMDREGQLGTDDALRFTEQVASALAHAHSRNIVHRDIKPENLLLQEDNVAIADFGIALAVESAGGDRLTETGLSLGTPSYMSPEQAAGEQGIDLRSDIYSLACVLYEMLAGDPPFTASNSRAVLAKHLTDPAPPVTTVRPGVGGPVAAAVARALEKAPADRFESVKAFSAALSAESEPAGEKQAKSIVVLPFANMSPDPDNEYFSDGLTEEIITNLSHIRSLRVTSRTSAMALKGTRKDVRTIGRELGVRYLLEGSVRKAGNDLRITAQLIDAKSDENLWAEMYDGALEDVFSIQETVSRLIVDALDLTLSSDEQTKLSERPIENVQAYECHLRAKYEIYLANKESLNRAKKLIENGLDLIGDNEVLYSDLGLYYSTFYEFVSKDDKGLIEKAQECVERVFSLNRESSHGYFLRGRVHLMHADIQEAAGDLKRATVLDPNNVNALLRLAWVYATSGQTLAAGPLIRRSLEIDPLTPVNHMIAGGVEWMDGRFDAGREHIRKSYELERTIPFFRYWYGMAMAYTGRNEEAYELFEMIERDSPEIIFAWLGRFFRHAHRGEKAKALASVTGDLRTNAREDEIYPIWMAESYSLIGEKDLAIDWLEHVVDFGFINYAFLKTHDPFLESIRGENRFEILMERIYRKQVAFEI